ncbi:Ig-like domain-containing protein [Aeromicrobium massiliense]|uniref:Ig-like domain-containing protein n=1 Tax=Aeromicrobium massiliense TaxID=1464554 RepID=UPI0002D72A47|nr:Ig-like domain-containing protein [Aeromicrobium massiliense]
MSYLRRRGRHVAVALAALPLVLVAGPAVAAPGDATVAEGPNYVVNQVAGGYEVTVELDEPLEVRDDAPTLVADGEPIGLAVESADRRSLTVFTSDPAVVRADEIEAGWSAESGGAGARKALTAVPDAAAEALDVDPASLGTVPFEEGEYDFGQLSVPLANISGYRGEMQGKVYVPTTAGEHKTVLLLHGRHSWCYNPTTNASGQAWPCAAGQVPIPSYAGYDGTARALASHGYSVISIAANGINARDNTYAPDRGAQARGQLILDTLTMLQKANAGQPVSFVDANRGDLEVTLADALTGDVSVADLVGKWDLDDIGLMGHSRGGEGITSATTLNQSLEKPFGIKTILPLAPVDFARMTVPDVAMNVVLPYCDGDVSNQQGQHMLDDSRYAFGDDVLRAGTWVMGANHNFYNTVWTPGLFPAAVSDDWSNSTARRTDAICGTDPTVEATSIRLTAQEQYDQGTAYMAGWFRLTLGGEKQFLPLFDGSGATPESLGPVDVRTVTTAPSSARATVASFESATSSVRQFGTATAVPCASMGGRTIPQALPACTTATIGSAQVPHWTPATNGGNVPATPVTRLTWTSATGEIRTTVPKTARDASAFERLSVKLAADETVTTGTDLTLSVVDGEGAMYSALVSALNPQALVRMPTSTGSTTLKKIVLQQVNVPLADVAAAGVDLTDVREVRFTAATGLDATASGAAYLSDLAFERSSVGTPTVRTQPTLHVFAPQVDEGNGPGTTDVAILRRGDVSGTASGYVSILGSTTSRAGAAMEKVTFAPGETCKVVTGSLQGDKNPSTTAGTAVVVSVINTAGAVMADNAVTWQTVREDDGLTNTVTPLPESGVPGDACAEAAASRTVTELTAGDTTPAPGQTTSVAASGFRAGESVAVSLGSTLLGRVVAGADGSVATDVVVPADAKLGTGRLTAVGQAFARTAAASVDVLHETTTTLAISPAAPKIGQPLTLTATVTGVDVAGQVEFTDGTTVLGTAPVTGGTATLALKGLKAGSHSLGARFVRTATAQSSAAAPVALTLNRDGSSTTLRLSRSASVFGTAVSGTVTVSGAKAGTVTVTAGRAKVTAPVSTSGTARFTLPRTLAVGSYKVTVRYSGSDTTEPSSVTSALKVTRKATSAAVSASSRVKRGRSFTVTARVGGAAAGVSPTGTVKVYVKAPGARSYKVVKTLRVGSTGKVTTKVKASKRGKASVKVVYSGDTRYGASTSRVTRVTVR